MIPSDKIVSALENIYISPLELCNLHCRHCYTQKTKNILSNRQVLNFVRRYNHHLSNQGLQLKSILFCGGEVFTLKNFPRLVNNLISKGIFISIITNGTIDKLSKIKDPRNCQLIVSFDGPQPIHDANRGVGNFAKSKNFVAHALKLGFPVEIFFLITRDSYPYHNTFPEHLSKALKLPNSKALSFTYLTDRLFSLTPSQTLDIKKNYPSYPSPQFGCFQLALQSNAQIYGCCESPYPLAKISDPIKKIVANFVNSLNPCQKCLLSDKQLCFGCCAPDYLCGYKKEFKQTSCQSVVKLFQP